MITPVWALTIDKLCERKNDLLFSDADIKELARNERAKAIDEFLHNAESKITDVILQHQGQLDFASGLAVANRMLEEIAEQMKGGAE